MGARIVDWPHFGFWVGRGFSTHKEAIVADFLCHFDVENWQTAVRVDQDEDRGTNRREDLTMLQEALLDVQEDRVLTKVIKCQQVCRTLLVVNLHTI